MPQNPLAAYPAIRLFVPFAIGIVIGGRHGSLLTAIIIAIISIGIYVLLHILSRNEKNRYLMRYLWIVPLFFISLAVGMATAIIHRPPELNLNRINGKPIEARVTSITRKDFSATMTATLQTKGYPQVQLSTRGCDYTINEGEYVRFFCNLKPIANQGNPDEMDYAGYMWRKGIRYQQHLDEKPFHYQKTGSFPDRLYGLRHRLETKVLNFVDDPFTQQLVIAMILGDSRVIDNETRNEFSRAGIAHTLALSGLHVGIIVWIVWMLLFPLDYFHLKKLRLALTIVALAAFCAVTGFSPSAMRAALMIAISFMTYILYRRYSPVNALLVTALLILIFQPFQLFSIGFQLSFITITALLITLPHWQQPHVNRFVGYAMTTLVTSIIAMLATMMLTAYYFNTISIISPLTNLLTLPLIPVVIGLGIVIIFMALINIHVPLVEWLTNATCKALYWSENCFANIEGGHISNVYISGITLTLYFIALVLLAWWLFNRRRSTLISAIAAIIVIVLTQFITTLRTPSNGLVVFNNFKYTPILAFDHRDALLWIPDYEDDPQFLGDEFIRQHRAFISHYRIKNLATVTKADTIFGNMAVHQPFALLCGKRIAVVDDKRSAATISEATINNDILIVGRHFKGNTLDISGTIIYSGAANVQFGNITVPQDCIEHYLANEGAYCLLN